MDHFIDTKIPKLGIFVDKNSPNDQTPFPKVGRKTPVLAKIILYSSYFENDLVDSLNLVIHGCVGFCLC